MQIELINAYSKIYIFIHYNYSKMIINISQDKILRLTIKKTLNLGNSENFPRIYRYINHSIIDKLSYFSLT